MFLELFLKLLEQYIFLGMYFLGISFSRDVCLFHLRLQMGWHKFIQVFLNPFKFLLGLQTAFFFFFFLIPDIILFVLSFDWIGFSNDQLFLSFNKQIFAFLVLSTIYTCFLVYSFLWFYIYIYIYTKITPFSFLL